jgi:NADH dehydrogenase (ubiquinone) Fe-S protein 6
LYRFTGDTSDYLWPLIKENLHTLVKQKQAESSLTEIQNKEANFEPVTHTGQQFPLNDYRRSRFESLSEKVVNENFAIDLVKQDPIVVADKRVVWSSGGGPLGHPKVYINLDRNEVHDCGYSGRRFILKKYYDPAKHGKSISYDEYLKEMEKLEYGL